MQHICDWEGHTEHEDEKDCFYTPVLAYVTDRSRLVSSKLIFLILVISHFICVNVYFKTFYLRIDYLVLFHNYE